MSDDDHIGVVREHRWTSVKLQRERLKADGCRVILDMKDTTRAELFRIVRSGTTVKLFRAYYLADPRNRKKKGGMRADALATLRRLCCKPPNGQGAVVKDVETGLSTAEPAQKAAIVALIKDQSVRDGKGLKSAENGANSKRGRVARSFPNDEMRDAKAAWRNVKDYPTWDAVKPVLPKGFTVHRAYKLWGKRT
jgi:hypothetical protein